MEPTSTDLLPWDGGVYQGATAADLSLEYGYEPTRTHVDPAAKADAQARPASFPAIGPARSQRTHGPDDEAALCSGQSPVPELISRRHALALEDRERIAATRVH